MFRNDPLVACYHCMKMGFPGKGWAPLISSIFFNTQDLYTFFQVRHFLMQKRFVVDVFAQEQENYFVIVVLQISGFSTDCLILLEEDLHIPVIQPYCMLPSHGIKENQLWQNCIWIFSFTIIITVYLFILITFFSFWVRGLPKWASSCL